MGRSPDPRSRHHFASTSALIGALLITASSALAQNSSPQPTEVLAEVVVTAQKRVENVQDVPKSVDVVTASELDEAGVNRITDLTRVSPSITGTLPLHGPPPI